MSPGMAVIELAFDPVARLGDLAVRWETLALAGVVLATLVLAAGIARSTPADVHADARAGILGPDGTDHLRRDDLLYVVLGALPGAVLGGRLGYAVVHPAFFAQDPMALLDPGRGSLELGGAALGASLTAAVVAGLLEAPVSRWFHVAGLPLLVAVSLGKAAQALGGSGQGTASTASWATAYVSPGPWGSLAPDLPAHPAQLYEAGLVGVALVLVLAGSAAGLFDRRDGRVFAVALVLWALVRLGVGVVWRDPTVLGPLRGGQVVALVMLVVGLAGFGLAPRLVRNAERKYIEDEPGVGWPDPETRPRF